MNVLRFELNQMMMEVSDIPPTLTLLRYLRDHLHLTGTKEGCAEGDCGACTVVVLNEEEKRYEAINSCLVLVPMLHGKRIFTVEHLKQNGEFHLVQTQLAKNLGSQCGYCTPGIVMSLFAGCYRSDLTEDWQIDDQMCGNLCRCTGYKPIYETARQVLGQCPQDLFLDYAQTDYSGESFLNTDLQNTSLHYEYQDQFFGSPLTFEDLWSMWQSRPDALLVSGGTDLGLMITKRFESPRSLISLEKLAPLHQMVIKEDRWEIGGGTSLSKIEALAKTHCPALERMLRFFGARQIKNRGTIGGNICTASPIGDTSPVLLALDAEVVLQSAQGRRTLPIHSFFTGYRQTALQDQELLVQINLPLSQPQIGERIESRAYKVSKRQELDISTVSAAFWMKLDQNQTLLDIRLAFGGMAATPIRATQVEQLLIGQVLTPSLIDQGVEAIKAAFTPFDDHRGSAWYRSTVAGNLWRGFCLEIEQNQPESLPYRPTATVVLR